MSSRQAAGWRQRAGQRFDRLQKQHPFWRHVLTLLSGTVVAQAVAMLSTLVCARLFTPYDYGQYGVYMSVVAAVSTMAALRFDVTVMLPATGAEAQSVFRLAARSIAITAPLTCALSLLLWPVWRAKFDSASLAWWMAGTGLTVGVLALSTLLQYWLNRHSDYRGIARNRVEQQVGISLGQMLCGFAVLGGMGGLVLGHFCGCLPALLLLLKRDSRGFSPRLPDAPSLRAAARRYRKMPLVNGPNALVDVLRVSVIQLLIGASATAALGFYNMATSLVQVPISLIVGSVTQVFFHRLSQCEPGELLTLVRQLWRRLALVGLPAFALLFWLAPWVFTILLGARWAPAGDYARALMPWLAMTMFTAPSSSAFLVAEKQQRLLFFGLVYTGVPIAILLWSRYSLLVTVWMMSAANAALLLGQLLSTAHTCREYDQRGIRRAAPDEPAKAAAAKSAVVKESPVAAAASKTPSVEAAAVEAVAKASSAKAAAGHPHACAEETGREEGAEGGAHV